MNELLIAGGILVFFILLALWLSNRRQYRSTMEKPDGVKHYEEARDQIVEEQLPEMKEEEPIEVEEEYRSVGTMSSGMGPGMISILVVALVIGIFFATTQISGSITQNQQNQQEASLYSLNVDNNTNNIINHVQVQKDVVDVLGTAGNAIVHWLDLIVLLIIIGLILGVFVKIGAVFNGEQTSTEKSLRRTLKNTRSAKVKHYEGMRDRITMAQIKKGQQRKAATKQQSDEEDDASENAVGASGATRSMLFK